MASERRELTAVGAAFAAQGLGYAVMVTTLPTYKSRFDLTDTSLSVVLLVFIVFAALGSIGANAIAVRWSSRRAVVAGLLVQAAALVLVLAAPSRIFGLASVQLFALGLGTVDAANNMQGVLAQRRHRAEIFGRLYALQTAAAIAGALIASGAAAVDVVLAALAIAAVVQAGVAGFGARALDPRRAAHQVEQSSGERPALPRRGILITGSLIFAVFAADAAVGAWSTVYLEDGLQAATAIAPLGYAAYQATVLVSRLVSDAAVARFGRVGTAFAGLVVGSIGCVVVASLPSIPGAIAGFAAIGVAAGAVVPIAFSAAGDLLPERSDEVIARVNLFNYAGAVVGAVALGLVSAAGSLGTAFLLPALFLMIGVASSRLVPARAAVPPDPQLPGPDAGRPGRSGQ